MTRQEIVPPSADPIALDAALVELQNKKTEWARLPISEKIGLLEGLKSRTAERAVRWVDAACAAKGLPPNSPLRGEEWTTGPWAWLYYLDPLRDTLARAEAGKVEQLLAGKVRQRADGQTIVRVLPDGLYDHLLLSGYEAEIWMEPGVTPDNLPRTMAGFYRQNAPSGAVALVLGAGNVSFIPAKDVLYKLYAQGQVCILKLNPVNAYLGPIFEEIFGEFIERGYLRTAYGGAEVGEYLTRHAAVEEIHVTGSAATHDAIVYGTGASGKRAKERDEPVVMKRITSELGGVTPVIVVPGSWTEADLQYQAEHIATMKMYNAGFNCIAAQVLVLPSGWPQRDALLAALRSVLQALPDRPAFYPGAQERLQAACAASQNVERFGDGSRALLCDVPAAQEGQPAFQAELFCGVLTVTDLPGGVPGENPDDYLQRAVNFCNERLTGTLSATILIHPRTAREIGMRLEDAVARLRYGTVGVNVWSAFAFLNPKASWGAFPGHTRTDIQSGVGVVNNALLFGRPQKSVVRGPFAPAPRSLLAGEWHTSVKPLWFVTNRTADVTAQRLAEFTVCPAVRRLPGILVSALRG